MREFNLVYQRLGLYHFHGVSKRQNLHEEIIGDEKPEFYFKFLVVVGYHLLRVMQWQ
jgi:hypothetical protein